eukprot:c2508_g1_i2.p1 GENE.c2508_g1_i2~~c2508_g1_i2.p1  ORF type:complete len:225 (+),score=33.02 c2508_g1_i2:35-676(+)
MSDKPFLDVRETESRSQKPRRSRKCLLVLVAVAAAFVIATCTTTWYFMHKVDESKYKKYDPPQQGCGVNSSLIMNMWYYGKQHITDPVEETFTYATMFHPNDTLTSADGNVLQLGNMYICGQARGTQDCGPVNCTNKFAYDTRNCSIAYIISDCSDRFRHTCTDMKIEWIAFNAKTQSVEMDFTTHFPGAGGVIKLTPSVAHPLDCSNLDPPQ